MPTELLDEIRRLLKGNGTIQELDEVRAGNVIDTVANKFIMNRSKVWWWQGLQTKPVVVEYGDNLSWPLVKQIVGNNKQIIYLFVTDDDPEPWPVLSGPLDEIGNLIANLWRTEYFLVDENFTWLLFDTHHNTLVVSGALEDRARHVSRK